MIARRFRIHSRADLEMVASAGRGPRGHLKAEGQISAATFTGRVDGSQAGLASNTSASGQAQGAAQYQENASKHGRQAQFQEKDASGSGDGCGAAPSPGQGFSRIQGGVINVSSVYFQG